MDYDEMENNNIDKDAAAKHAEAKDERIQDGKVEAEAGDLPAGAALSWGLIEPPKRGPKRELSVSLIVQTAVSIADQEGLSAVSMKRVASALGFTAMSLYRYIPAKSDLLLLMQDAVCQISLPSEGEDGDWRESMRELVRVTIQLFQAHPWYVDIPITGIPVTPNILRFIDWALQPMRDFPLNDFEKMSIVLLVNSYARSVGLIHRDIARAMREGAGPDEFSGMDYTGTLKRLVRPDQFPNLYPVVMSGAYTGENEEDNTVGDDFDFGLERILDGIAVYLDSRQAGQPE